MSTLQEIQQLDAEHVMQTYGRLPVAFVRGEGVKLWDSEGNEYLDFLGGLAVTALGHAHPAVAAAVAEQARTLLHVSNLYYNEVQPQVAAHLDELLGGGGRVFFANSGAEANECAIKLARRHGQANGGPERFHVLSALGSFHGRTLTTLAATGQPQKQETFEPLPTGFRQVGFGDLDSLAAAMDERVCAVMLEPIQGEGGVLPAPPGYLAAVRALCDEREALLVVDEVQTGLGRTGRMLALEHWGVEPDLITVAKSLSGGLVPSGALLMSDAVFESVFDSMENALAHGSTFAPHDFASVAGLATLHELESEGLVARSARLGELLLERTRPLVERYEVVKDVRGLGLMWAIEFGEPEAGQRAWRLMERMQQGIFSQMVIGPLFWRHRVMSQVAGHNVNILKCIPPLVVTESDVDWFASALESVLQKNRRLPTAMVGFAAKMARQAASASR
jgi:acetylornithine/N-succinyldiaminopimelate aminotransferase